MVNQEFKRMKDQVFYLPSEKKTMAIIKLWVLMLIDLLCIPLSIYGFILNMDNIKSSTIALISLIYLLWRLYFMVIQKKQAVRQKEIEIEKDKIATEMEKIRLWQLQQEKLRQESKTGK